MNNDYEKRLWKVLEKENLVDLSQFHEPGGFDEVPLFSRERDVEFLRAEKNGASEILLRFALKFLSSVIAYEEHRRGYFAAITLWSLAGEPLVPNLFAWRRGARDLKNKLALDPATTSFAKRIKSLLAKLRLADNFDIAEDTLTIAGETRVFIAPRQPPYQGFVPLSVFRKHALGTSR